MIALRYPSRMLLFADELCPYTPAENLDVYG